MLKQHCKNEESSAFKFYSSTKRTEALSAKCAKVKVVVLLEMSHLTDAWMCEQHFTVETGWGGAHLNYFIHDILVKQRIKRQIKSGDDS